MSSSSSSLKEHPSGLQQEESMNSRQQFNSCEEQLGHFFSGFPELNPVFSSSLEQQQHEQELQMAELNAIVSSPPRSLSSIMGNRALSGLVQKIGHLQMLVQLVGEGRNGNQQQHLATAAGIGRLIDQLLVAAKGILVEQHQHQAVQQHHLLSSSNSSSNQFSSAAAGIFEEGILAACSGSNNNNNSNSSYDFIRDEQQMPFHGILPKTEDDEQLPWNSIVAAAAQKHEDGGDDDAAENLPHGAYNLIEMDAMEIMAEHTHFCEICGKGFKRDANLRMHMRGHGDEYKTAAALARPKESIQDQQQMAAQPKRYSCPYGGCKRNKNHKKFVPLKTMLCVKNHYRRSHCPKRLACTKCRVKRFAVLADLKTHEKHCGREKWQCSCGTTFSRKDKLLGHVALFLGHKPLVMLVPSPPPPPPPVLLGESAVATAAYAQNGQQEMKLPMQGFLAHQQEVAYFMGNNFHAAAAGGNISNNNNSSTVMLVGGGSQLSSGGSSSVLTTTEVGATVESCWSPSIFTSNNNNNVQQESNNNNSSSSSSSLGFVGLDFFNGKS